MVAQSINGIDALKRCEEVCKNFTEGHFTNVTHGGRYYDCVSYALQASVVSLDLIEIANHFAITAEISPCVQTGLGRSPSTLPEAGGPGGGPPPSPWRGAGQSPAARRFAVIYSMISLTKMHV